MKKLMTYFFIITVFIWNTKAQLDEDFDGTFPPYLWLLTAGGGNFDQSQDIADHTNGTGSYARYDCFNISSSTPAYMSTPTLNVTASDHDFTFWVNYYFIVSGGGSNDELYIDVSNDGGATWVSGTTNYINGQENAGWFQVSIDLTNYEGQDFTGNNTVVRFKAISHWGSYSIAIDDVQGPSIVFPSCMPPSDLTASNIYYNSVDLGWTENGSATNWNIEYGPAGFTQGQGSVVSATSNPFTLTGINSATYYDYYVQADCGGGDTSSWIGPYSFYIPPTCGDTFYDDGGANNNYSSNLSQIFTIYPQNPGDVVTVTFNSFETEEGYDNMMIYNGPDTLSPVFSSGSSDESWSGGPGAPYTAEGQSFTSTDSSGALTFVFTSDESDEYSGWEAVVTCGPPPTCPNPSLLSAANFTSNSAELSWVENGSATSWNIEYGPTGYTQGQGTTVTATNIPFTLTGLNPSTYYDFYVQSDCGGGDTSDWIGPYTFVTGGTCGLFKIDLLDNFGDGWTGGYLDVYINGTLFTNLTLDTGFGPETHYIPVDNDDIMSIVYTAGSFSDENEYIVYDNNDVQLAYEGANHATPGSIGDPSIPEGLIACPSCPSPLNLSAGNLTNNSADLSWTETGSATTWNIEYGPTGFAQGQGTIVTATSNPFTLTGLSHDTTYDYYVQADCGNGDTSIWSGPYTFSTICDVITTFPYNYGFEDVTPNTGGDWSASCWTANPENTNSDYFEGPFRWTVYSGLTPSNNTGPENAHSGQVYAYTEASGANPGDSAELFSPIFDLSALSQPQLSFYYHMYGDNMGILNVDFFDGTTWNEAVWSVSGGQQTSSNEAWIQSVISVPNNVIRIKFRAIRGFDYTSDMAIDDISIQDATSINQLTNITGIYPNPTTGQFVIKSHDLSNAEIYVYTLTGKEIYHNIIDSNAFIVNLKNVTKGVYLIKITDDNRYFINKLIVK